MAIGVVEAFSAAIGTMAKALVSSGTKQAQLTPPSAPDGSIYSMTLPLAVDWPTIASLATAGGTLVLAVATFSSVRFGQRSTRFAERSTALAERALLLGLRPVLVPSRVTDSPEMVRFGEGRMVNVEGGMAAVERGGRTTTS